MEDMEQLAAVMTNEQGMFLAMYVYPAGV